MDWNAIIVTTEATTKPFQTKHEDQLVEQICLELRRKKIVQSNLQSNFLPFLLITTSVFDALVKFNY